MLDGRFLLCSTIFSSFACYPVYVLDLRGVSAFWNFLGLALSVLCNWWVTGSHCLVRRPSLATRKMIVELVTVQKFQSINLCGLLIYRWFKRWSWFDKYNSVHFLGRSQYAESISRLTFSYTNARPSVRQWSGLCVNYSMDGSYNHTSKKLASSVRLRHSVIILDIVFHQQVLGEICPPSG